MSLFFRTMPVPTANQLIPQRAARRAGSMFITADAALRHSGVWACLRLRADLISTMPIDTYRKVDGKQVVVPTPRILVNPGGERVDITEWMYSTQVDLDRYGNTFGLITERDGAGLPARIDLVPAGSVSVVVRDGQLSQYRIDGKLYEPAVVWHEKQFTVAGLHVGLAPVSYAAWATGSYLSAQEFALDFFGNGGIPSGHFKNKEKKLDRVESDEIKNRFKEAIASRDVLVTGSDWEYSVIGVPTGEAQFLETMKASLGDVCRFYGVPGDMIDVEGGSSSVTYANITQRNLQLLIINLGPATNRRERALGRLLPQPRYVKLNSDAAVLRMDPVTRATYGKTLVEARLRAPSELREKDDLLPFTEEQFAEFDRLFARTTVPTAKTAEAS